MIHRNSSDLHFGQIMTLLRRRRLFVALVVILGGGMAAVVAFVVPPYYTAKAQLLYLTEAQPGTEKADDAAVDTLVEMLLSPGQLRRLATSLQADPGVVKPVSQAPQPQDAIRKLLGDVPLDVTSYDALAQGINVYKERQSRLVAITFRSTDPASTALVVNRSVKLYLDHEAEVQRDARDKALASVTDRMPDARTRISQAEGALREHKIKYGLTDTTAADPTDRQIGELTRQLMIARSDLAARDAQFDKLGPQPAGAAARQAPAMPGLEQAAARDQVIDVAGGASPVPADDQGAMVAQMVQGRDAALARLNDIEARLKTLQEASATSTDAWIRLRELEGEANAAAQAYEALLHQKSDLQGQATARPTVRLVSMAEVPNLPSSPNPLLFVAPAIIAALLIGGLLAVLFERLDKRLHSERDVEETLDAPCIGMVPSISGRKRAALSQLLRNDPFAPYTEAIRSVFVAATRMSAQTILITSSGRKEGKTTLLVSLAAFGARLGKRVLVIDFDLRHPRLLGLLGAEKGQTTAVAATMTEASAKDVIIRRADKYGFDYLSLPRLHIDPLTVLSNEDFPVLLQELRRDYDCILIDSAPVAAATETRLLASMVDRVIMVARWGVTEVGPALAAMQQLRASGPTQDISIAVVVNQVNLGTHERGGYSDPVPMLPAQVG